MARTRLEWAQWMGAKGIGVFMVRPGTKNPVDGYSWYSRQSTDPEVIKEYFAHPKYPDCNYGLWLGEKYVVVDLDIKPDANGIDELTEICEEHGEFYEGLKASTLCVTTPGGGVHLYFKSPFAAGIANDFPEGIDVRGVNGYVVGPGSADSRGEWAVLDPDKEIADLPEFLHEYVRPPGLRDPKAHEPLVDWDLDENVTHALNWLHDRTPAVEGDHGDQWTLETVYFLRDFGLSEDKILWAMNQGWNQLCEPPWDDAQLEVKIRNAFAYPQNRPGCKSPAWRAQRVQMFAGGGQWAKYLTPEAKAELFRPSHNLKLVVNNDAEIPDGTDDEIDPVTGEPAKTFPWFEWGEFRDRGSRREYVIHNWLLSHGISHMVASRGTGKSTIALDMAAHIACDLDWCGMPTAKGWKVIYICGEDDVGMETNVVAWSRKYGLDPDPGRFLIAADVIKLTDQTRLDIRVREMMEWAAGERVVVFLDTWQRSTMGWGKNDQEAMETAVGRAERLAQYLRGPLVSLVHPPKDGRMTVKGAGEQEDTSSAIYHLNANTGGVRIEIERIKGPGKDSYIQFEFDYIDLGETDDFGKPIIGLCIDKTSGKVGEARNAMEEDRHERAWAKAIYGITKDCFHEIYEPKGLNIDNVAKFLDHVVKACQDIDSEHKMLADDYVGNWLNDLTNHLSNKDISNLTHSQVKKTLDELFGDVPFDKSAAVTDYGKMMYFSKANSASKAKNPQRRFSFGPAPKDE